MPTAPDHQLAERIQGVGLGLRFDLHQELLSTRPSSVKWLEIHPENYVRRGGRYRAILEASEKHWPLITHGLSMGFGNNTPCEAKYLDSLATFLDHHNIAWHSDHLCFVGSDGVMAHDLLPLPHTLDAAKLATTRIREAQSALGKPIAIENISAYGHLGRQSDSAPKVGQERSAHGWTEEQFVNEVLERSDAYMLLDVNNVYVNAMNHGFSAERYIDAIPKERVIQLHIAGHWQRDDGLRIDTHGEAICDDVYQLLDYTLRHIGKVPVLLERDDNIPSLDDILVEVDRIEHIYDKATAEQNQACAETGRGTKGILAKDPIVHDVGEALSSTSGKIDPLEESSPGVLP